MSTPIPSTTPKPGPSRTAHPGAKFVRERGPVACWTSGTCDLYLDLYSSPSPRRPMGASQ
ncbi:hypothetical protein R1T08_02860 [Streptomyces sp. SBC-4]|nr:hypothetical protein [Streptomyces sp. SBC-4]MDV5143277.1 hypothetical protein [Streptomyces sp. SBC-4]